MPQWLKSYARLWHNSLQSLCPLCAQTLSGNRSLCPACELKLPYLLNPCPGCGLPGKQSEALCLKCLKKPPPWQQMLAPLVYSGAVREALMAFKFQHDLSQGRWLAQVLAQAIQHQTHEQQAPNQIDAIIPIPLYRSRLFERGFNQSLELAQHLSRELHIPVQAKALERQRDTPHQTGLSLVERQRNLRLAFGAATNLKGQNIALLDDIITSGTTLTAASHCLLKAGAQSVTVWAVARALVRHK